MLCEVLYYFKQASFNLQTAISVFNIILFIFIIKKFISLFDSKALNFATVLQTT